MEARAGKFPGPSLIPALNAIQARLGWLPRAELEELARDTRRPRYEIEGLISFYPHFRTEPPAKVALHVCHDLPCNLATVRPAWRSCAGATRATPRSSWSRCPVSVAATPPRR